MRRTGVKFGRIRHEALEVLQLEKERIVETRLDMLFGERRRARPRASERAAAAAGDGSRAAEGAGAKALDALTAGEA